jgi:hypothetical protein
MEKYSDNNFNSMGADAFSNAEGFNDAFSHADGHHKTHRAEGDLNAHGKHVHHRAEGDLNANGHHKVLRLEGDMSASGHHKHHSEGELYATGASGWDETLIVQKYKGLLHSLEALKSACNSHSKSAARAAMDDVNKYTSDLNNLI